VNKVHNRRMLVSGTIKTLAGLSIGAVLWRLRIPQVAAFVTAAAINSQVHHRNGLGLAARSAEWPENRVLPSSLPSSLSPLALVSYHPEYQNFAPRMAIASLEAAVGLGFGWIRSDIRWREVFPDGQRADENAINWYRNFLVAASSRGLRNMVVLSSPPRVALQQTLLKRHELWDRFVQTVVEKLGNDCHAYQLMNEPNNPVYRFFDLQNAARALVRATSVIRGAYQRPITINISTDLWGWRAYLSRLLELSGEAVNIVGLDHYPSTWTLGPNSGWADVFEIAEMMASAQPDSVWFNRRLAILETGYSTNAPLRTQTTQSRYFENLSSMIQSLRGTLSVNGDVLLGIYELIDGDSSIFLDPEAHFGVFTSDLQPKLAIQAVRDLVLSLSRGGASD
jgi:hypothetical protein